MADKQWLGQTPSQTVGPYFAYGLAPTQYGYEYRSLFDGVLAQPQADGQHIDIVGQVFDGAGTPIMDALIEISHADANGRPVGSKAAADASGFRGFGRFGTGTTTDHHFAFHTVKPGSVGPGLAPYVDVIVLMRGMLVHTYTRIYFDDEAAANAKDPVLDTVPADRRATLVARRIELPGGISYRFDIHMQGPQETVFFDL